MVAATSIMRVQQSLLADFDAIVGAYGLTFAPVSYTHLTLPTNREV